MTIMSGSSDDGDNDDDCGNDDGDDVLQFVLTDEIRNMMSILPGFRTPPQVAEVCLFYKCPLLWSVFLEVLALCVCLCLSVCLSVCLCLSLCLSGMSVLQVPIALVCLSRGPCSMCLSLSVCLSVCLSLSLSLWYVCFTSAHCSGLSF